MKEPTSKRSFSPSSLLSRGLAAAALVGVVGFALGGTLAQAEPAAKVTVNGKLVGVFFNDGDSFRIIKGSSGKARLAGFNTLESHGAVHQWGDWTAKEMYVIAKMATLNARKGTWSCDGDGNTDTYGRLLLYCKDLATDQVRKGLAHAMTITDDPAKPELLEAQREAITNRRGIWAHGVPEFIVTSLHSVEEDVNGHGTYNRLISSADGHTLTWKHNNKYSECDNVCLMSYPEDASLIPAVMAKLKAEAPQLIAGLNDGQLGGVLATYQRVRLVDRPAPKEHRQELNKLLKSYADQGLFGTATGEPSSCMVHVPFKRRYGGGRAACLKK